MEVRTNPSVPHAEFFPHPSHRRKWFRWLDTIARDREELVRFWPVVQNMVVQELRVRYQRSFLGFVWTLLHPVLMMTILTLVFSHLIKKENYVVYIFAGMVPWGFLSASLLDSTTSIIQNESLIRKIYLPKLIFPLAKVLLNLTTFLLTIAALFLLLKPMGAKFSWALFSLPLVIALFFAFALGLGLLVATANTFFRDCGHLVTVFLQVWYFATPIIYEITDLPEAVRWRLWLNPAFPYIQMFQMVLREGQWPLWSTFSVAAGIAVVSLGIGYAAFKSQEDKLVFRL